MDHTINIRAIENGYLVEYYDNDNLKPRSVYAESTEEMLKKVEEVVSNK